MINMSVSAQTIKRGVSGVFKNGGKKGATKAAENVVEQVAEKSLVGTAMGVGLPLFFAGQTYKDARNEGNGMINSGLRAAGDFAIQEMMGGGLMGIAKYMALQAVPAIPKAAVGAAESLNTMSRNMNRATVAGPFSTATFNDNQQKYTMRQSGMQLAQASKYNLQQTLMGNEAQYMKY